MNPYEADIRLIFDNAGGTTLQIVHGAYQYQHTYDLALTIRL